MLLIIKESENGYINTMQSRFQSKEDYEDKEYHFTMIKLSICQEDKTFLNAYLPNRSTKYMKQ